MVATEKDFENISEPNQQRDAKDNTKNIGTSTVSSELQKIMCTQCNIQFGSYDPYRINRRSNLITKEEKQLKYHISLFHEENFKCIDCGEEFDHTDKSKSRNSLQRTLAWSLQILIRISKRFIEKYVVSDTDLPVESRRSRQDFFF